MQLHKIVGTKPEAGLKITRFAGSLKDASALREDLRKLHGLKRSEIVSGPVEVPTTKPELLLFLNAEAQVHDSV